MGFSMLLSSPKKWFNTTEVEMNMFVMADDVYNMMEIFSEAATFQARMIKHIDHMLEICDVLVFMLLATIVGQHMFRHCLQKLQRTVSRSTSNIPRIMAQMKKIKEKQSIRGSNANFREVEEEKIISGWNTKYIQNQIVQGYARSPMMATNIRNDNSEPKKFSRRVPDDDEITLKPPVVENYSAKLIGTPEWAANCLATGGPRQKPLHIDSTGSSQSHLAE
ncbi:uncharacterized protein LOC111069034 [Drosophila obscura]|uniref:uncharacterized protein LOC111069034 n=1 Tax=Drosophila obscura TaxID=7282 RepID=UPI000BA04936|nr:uncharacterized protein LOC111069034 [Drosophila obscura]